MDENVTCMEFSKNKQRQADGRHYNVERTDGTLVRTRLDMVTWESNRSLSFAVGFLVSFPARISTAVEMITVQSIVRRIRSSVWSSCHSGKWNLA